MVQPQALNATPTRMAPPVPRPLAMLKPKGKAARGEKRADHASDEKMEKLIARRMIRMVRDINAHFQGGKQHVTCYTCHRGSITPATAP